MNYVIDPDEDYITEEEDFEEEELDDLDEIPVNDEMDDEDFLEEPLFDPEDEDED